MADDNDYTMNKYTKMWVHTLRCSIEELENRLTALESRTCAADAPATSRPNVEPAASAGASTVLASGGSAASSAGSGGTDGSASFDASATANKSSAESAFGAASTPPDPVSAAIRKLLGLRPDLELLIYDNDGVNFGVRLLDASAEGPAKCVRRRISFDLPFVIESFIAAEVAAAKAKPHAETAEEVVQPPKEIARYADALRWTPTSRVYVDWNKTYYVYPSRLALLRTDTEPVNCVHPEEKVIEKGCALVPNVTAIKRERGEA